MKSVNSQKLPRKGRTPVKHWTQNIPIPLWNRMRAAGLGWGEVSPFINQAIKEKLDRLEQKGQPEEEPGITGLV